MSDLLRDVASAGGVVRLWMVAQDANILQFVSLTGSKFSDDVEDYED